MNDGADFHAAGHAAVVLLHRHLTAATMQTELLKAGSQSRRSPMPLIPSTPSWPPRAAWSVSCRRSPAAGNRRPRRSTPFGVLGELRSGLAELVPDVIDLEARLDGTTAHVRVSAPQLHCVVSNLFTNAVDAVEHDGRILLSAAATSLPPAAASRLGLPTGRYVRISVADDGRGMDPTELTAAVEHYSTTRQRPTPRRWGTGPVS
ncbi:MAG: ATP-binding protein [Egibacteraceae bacterium]